MDCSRGSRIFRLRSKPVVNHAAGVGPSWGTGYAGRVSNGNADCGAILAIQVSPCSGASRTGDPASDGLPRVGSKRSARHASPRSDDGQIRGSFTWKDPGL